MDGNPFQDPDLVNPFQDPSILQATQTSNHPAPLDDYNPFADQQKVKAPYPSSSQPAVMQPTSQPPPYSAQPKLSTEELQRRQEELERKAAELARREEELKNIPYNARTPNWPPLPAFCPQPCFYQDINVDIPLEFQKVVRTMYYLWMFDASVMLLNIVGALALWIGLNDGSVFVLSIVYLLVFTPAGYLCWFRPIYKAFRSDSSFNFFVFFFIFFFNCLLKGLFALGVPGVGACGWYMTIKALSISIGAGIVSLLVALALSVDTLANAFMLLKIHQIYRGTGASFAKAQQEFTSQVLRNEHVQNVATNAAGAAVRQTMTSNNLSQQQPGSRY